MITKDSLLREALDAIPEFKKEYEEQLSKKLFDDEAGLHIVFGYAFASLLVDAIKKNKPLAKRMFDFVERMSLSADRDVQEVCDFSILEVVCDEYEDNDFWDIIGESTKEGVKATRKYIV